jgi:hypothetical protein
MSDEPFITSWRLVVPPSGPPGILVGLVSGHPLVSDGWITTSVVLELDRTGARARTASRWYRLGEELPDHLPLPAAAQDVLLSRILKNAERLGWSGSPDELESIRDRLGAPKAGAVMG